MEGGRSRGLEEVGGMGGVDSPGGIVHCKGDECVKNIYIKNTKL